jgi:hypothetical protein
VVSFLQEVNPKIKVLAIRIDLKEISCVFIVFILLLNRLEKQRRV